MPKRKHVQLSIADKLKIIEDLEKGVKPAKISADYGIAKQTISDIKKSKEKLMKYSSDSLGGQDSGSASRKSGVERKRVQYGRADKLEEAVVKWYRQQISVGVSVRGIELKHAAKTLGAKMGIENFVASDGWLFRFRKRYGLRNTKMSGEASSADVAEVSPFREKLLKIIAEEGLVYAQIYNFDETGLVWRALPTNTQASKAMGEVRGRKLDKARISVLVGGNADGTHRLKPVVVGKAKKPRSLKDVMDRLPVHYYSSHNAWFTSAIFTDVFHKHIVKEIVSHQCHTLKIDEERVKALVLLDNAPAHPAANKLVALNGRIRVMYLPPNTTSLIQPMDQGVIHAVKLGYRRAFMEEVLVVEETEEDEDEDTRGQRTLRALKAYTIKSAIHNFAEAWKALKMTTLANSWKRLLFDADVPVVDFTGFETDDFIKRFQSAGETVNEEHLEEWLGIDEQEGSSEMLTDAEIVASVVDDPPVVEGEDDEDDVHVPGERMSLAVGRKLCDDLLTFISEREPTMPKHSYENIRPVRRAIIDLQHNVSKQTTIESFFRPKSPTPPCTPTTPVQSTSSAFTPTSVPFSLSDSESDE